MTQLQTPLLQGLQMGTTGYELDLMAGSQKPGPIVGPDTTSAKDQESHGVTGQGCSLLESLVGQQPVEIENIVFKPGLKYQMGTP
jgi:hypothetical protein